jgi:hypothetical protein
VRHVADHLRVRAGCQGWGIDRRSGRHDGAHGQLRDRIDAPLQQIALTLLARAETDEDQRYRPGAEVDLVDLAAQRRCVEHRSDARR